MRIIVPLFLFLLLTGNLCAQPGSGWQWTSSSARATQSPGRSVIDIHTDASGNVYTIGFFMGNMTVGAYSITTAGDGSSGSNFDQDAFIAKYDANGNISWLKRYGVVGIGSNDRGQVITADAAGDIYAGMGYGKPDVVKYDASGNVLWIKTLDLYDVGGINVASDGNLIVMTTNGTAKNIFKLSKTDGSIIWQVANTNVGCNGGSTFQDFIDAQGNIYYTCFTASAVTAVLAGETHTTAGLASFFVSLDKDGNRRWVQQMNDAQVQLSYTIDKNGKSYIQIGGGFGSTFQGISTASPLGNRYFELNNQGVVTRYAFQSPYKGLFRVKDDGIYSYALETGGTARTAIYGDYYFAIPASAAKTIGIITKYNASTDQVIWANSFEMSGQAYVAGSIATIETGPGSKVQVGGTYGAASAFGSFTNTATAGPGYSQSDFFISQFDGANVTAPSVATWTGGAGNTSWSDAGNWNGGVPTAAMKAVIAAGAPLYPQNITAANLVAKLEIASGAAISLPVGFTAPAGIVNMGSIEVIGTGSFLGFNNNASPLTGTGRLIFTANSPSSTYYGNMTGSLEINKPGGNIGYSGGNIAGSLYLTNGTLSVSPYDLVLTDPAAVVTYSPASFINYGKIKRAVYANGTYAFPVGSTGYAPVILQLNNITGPQFITAGYTSGVNITPNLTINGSVISSLLNAGKWSVTGDAAITSGSYNITLESRTSTNGVTDPARYAVVKRDGDNHSWGFEGKKGSATQTGGTTSGSTVSNATVTMVHQNLASFGDFATGIGSIAISDGTETNTSRWTGAAGNGLWTDAANWNSGTPSSLTKAVIPAGIAIYPQGLTASNITGKLEIEPGADLKLPFNFQAPGGIVNNGAVELTGGNYFKGFGNFTNGFASLNGTGKLVFKSPGSIGISASGDAEVINQNIEVVNFPGMYTNNFFTSGNVTLINSISQGFTMTNPDAAFTFSGDSYVTGNIVRSVRSTGTYSFPFMNGTAKVSFNNVTGPSSITASFSTFVSGAAPNLIVNGNTVDKLLNNGLWTITPNSALTGGSYSITLETNKYTNGVTDAARYIVLKRPNSSGAWAFFGNNGTSVQTGGTNNGSGVISNGAVSATAGNITGFSDFAIGIASAGVPTTLPVKLNGFTVKAINKTAVLNWQTSLEVNSDRFVVEKSKDALSFTAIGEVQAAGSSNRIIDYSFRDNYAGNGIVYYRLKQLDTDGKSDYSEIRMVSFTTSAEIKVFPNPFVETIYISGLTGKTQAKVFTPDGQLLMDVLIQNNQLRLPAGLNKGMYILQLKRPEEVKPYLYFLQK